MPYFSEYGFSFGRIVFAGDNGEGIPYRLPVHARKSN